MGRPGEMAAVRLAAAIAALALCLAAARASAEDERTRFSIHPSIRLVGIFDDNLHLEEDDPESGFGAWVQPGVEAGYRTRWLELGADLGADLKQYPGESSLSQEFWRAAGFAEVGVLPGLSLRVSDAYAPQPFQLGLPEDESGNLVQTNRADAEVRYWRELPRARELELGLRGTRFSGESFRAEVPGPGDTLIVQDDFRPDFWEGAAYAELQNPLGRSTTAYLRGQARMRSFDDSSRSDFTDFGLILGVRSRRFRNLEIELGGGWGMVVFRSEGATHRALGNGSLRHRLGRGWSWRVSIDHMLTADLAGNEFLETTGRLGVEKRFGERTAITAGAFASRFDNETWDTGEDLFAGAEIGVRRQITRRMQAKLGYRHWINGGDYEFDDFSQNRIALELSYRY